MRYKAFSSTGWQTQLPHSHEQLGPLTGFIAGRVMNQLQPLGNRRFSPHRAPCKGRLSQTHPIKLNSGPAELEMLSLWVLMFPSASEGNVLMNVTGAN